MPPDLPRFATQLLDRNRDVWDAMQSHRFVADIVADRLPPDVFARYLVFEHRFVQTAILIFGHALLKAPGFAQRRWLIGVLHALAEDQVESFRSAFGTLGLAGSIDAAPPPAAVHAFDRGMLEIAEAGSYLDILVAMLAAEWMYATWCGRASAVPISSPELRRWVALHADAGFRRGVDWLRAEVDAAGASLDPAERDRLTALFRRVLLLEIDFHAAAYDAS